MEQENQTEKEKKTLSPEECIQKMEAGETIENSIIEELYISGETGKIKRFDQDILFKNCIISSLAIHDCKFLGKVTFQNVEFRQSIFLGNKRKNLENLEDTENCGGNLFHQTLNFIHSSFSGPLDLAGSTIEGKLLIRYTQLESFYLGIASVQEIEFHECQLSQILFAKSLKAKSFLIRKSIFQGKAKFRNCQMEYLGFLDSLFHQPLHLEQIWFQKADLSHSQFQGCRFYGLHGKTLHCQEGHFKKKFQILDSEIGSEIKCIKSFWSDHFELRNSIIQESLSFPGCFWKKSAKFENLDVRGSAFFKGSYFGGPSSFQRSSFAKEALFNEVHFHGSCKLQFATFGERTSFSSAIFDFDLNGYRARFNGNLYCLGTRFNDVSFVNTAFMDQVFFSFDRNTIEERTRLGLGEKETRQPLLFVAYFEGKANFTNSLFYKKVIFENITFQKEVLFRNTYFGEESSFRSSQFLGEVNFEATYCAMELNFRDVIFHRYANFDRANINRRLNLTGAVLLGGISFFHAIIDVVVVEREQIEGNLIYEGKIAGKEELQNFFKVKEEYLILKESFQQRGKFQEEDWAYYQYRVMDRKSLTRKAWQSLWGKEITEWLDVQKTVPLEDQKKALDSDLAAQKSGSEKRIQKLEEEIKSLEEDLNKTFLGDSGKEEGNDEAQEKQKEQISSDRLEKHRSLIKYRIQQKKEALEVLQTELAKWKKKEKILAGVLSREELKLKELHKLQQRPFTFLEALWRLILNGFWCLVDWSTGYGVRPFRIGIMALVLIGIYTFLYLLPFLPQLSQKGLPFILDTLNFSALVFVTEVGQHDVLTQGIAMEFLVVSEAFLGLFFMALFVGCYTRKIIR